MTDPRGDVGRAAVYACETAAFDGTDLEEVQAFDAVARLIDRVVDGGWWPGPPIGVRVARRGVASSGTHGPIAASASTPVIIRLASSQTTTATAAHELAHALAGIEHGHDAVFRRAYLDVIQVITNLDPTDRRGDLHTRQLADAFALDGLHIESRRWPPPHHSVGGPIAL